MISRRSLFASLFAAPFAVAAGMPLADKLGLMAQARAWVLGHITVQPVVTIIESDDDQGQPGKWEIQGDRKAWQKWIDEHPFGRYKTEAGQAIGRAKHALLDREIMREHGLPEYKDGEGIRRKVLNCALGADALVRWPIVGPPCELQGLRMIRRRNFIPHGGVAGLYGIFC